MVVKKVIMSGVLTTKTGLSIGGTKDDIGIGTSDNPVIKNPLTGQPYIPGSSIKGKMRSLFETAGLQKGNDAELCRCGREDCVVCKMFGAHMNPNAKSGSPRVLFRDAMLAPEFERLQNVIELKTETCIDRATGVAKNGSLRQKERVAAGVNFDYEIVILVHDNDDEEELIGLVKNGLKMIEATGLGSKITAGYGKVDFNIDKMNIEAEDFAE